MSAVGPAAADSVSAVLRPVPRARRGPRALADWVAGRPLMSAPVFVVIYLFLLLCIPAQLIVGPMGAPGTPANLWAICGLIWWVMATIGGYNPIKGWTTLRVVIAALAVCVLLAYVAGNAQGWYAPADVHQVTDESWTLTTVSQADLLAKMTSAADRGLIYVAAWIGIALMAGEGLRTREQINLVVRWTCWFGAFVATLGILQFYTGVDIAGYYHIPGLTANSDFGAVSARSVLNRVSSTAVHPIEFGVVMAGILMLSLHRSLALGTSAAWLNTAVIAMAMPMSVSRSAILAVVVAIAVCWVRWPGRWRLWSLVLAPVCVVALRLMAPGLVGTIRSFFTNVGVDPSISGRTEDYEIAARLFLQNPVVGQGMSTLVPRYFRTFDNQILVSTIELGLVGIIALSAVFFAAVLSAWAAAGRLSGTAEGLTALAVAGSLVGIGLSYFTFDALGFSMVAGVSFFLVGLAAALGDLRGPDGPDPTMQQGEVS